MSTVRFTDEFKLEAVKQITEHQRPVADVAKRLGVSTHSLSAWVKRYGKPAPQCETDDYDASTLRQADDQSVWWQYCRIRQLDAGAS